MELVEKTTTVTRELKQSDIHDINLIKVTEVIQQAFGVAKIKGSILRPEIYVPFSNELDIALTNLGLDPFPDGDDLIITAWRDIGVLVDLKLIVMQQERERAGTIHNRVIHLLFPDIKVQEEKFEYSFPTAPSEQKVFTYTKAPTVLKIKETTEIEERDSVDFLEAIVSDWDLGVFQDYDDRLHEQNAFPNLKLFPKQYVWESGKLFKLETINGVKKKFLIGEEEQSTILERGKNGDSEALTMLLHIHRGFLLQLVRRQKDYYGGVADDLFQCAQIGLLLAVKNHDVEKGGLLTWIRWHVSKEFRQYHYTEKGLIKLSSEHRSRTKHYYEIKEVVEKEFGREVPHSILAKKMETTSEWLDQFERQNGLGREFIGLAHDDQLTLGHMSLENEDMTFDKTNTPEREAMLTEMQEMLRDIVRSLPENQSKVITMRFLLDCDTFYSRLASGEHDGLTLEQVSKQFGLTRGRIGAIEATALRKLRHPSRTESIRSYVNVEFNSNCDPDVLYNRP